MTIEKLAVLGLGKVGELAGIPASVDVLPYSVFKMVLKIISKFIISVNSNKILYE